MQGHQEVFETLTKVKIYDLSVEFFIGMPHPVNSPPFSFSLLRTHQGTPDSDHLSSAACFFAMGGHTGTHIDAFNHVAEGGKVFNHDESVFDHESYSGGVTIGSIDESPIIVRRGVLLDIPRVKGIDVLRPGDVVSQEDLMAAEKIGNVQVATDDVVLIRTGWMHWWAHDPGRYSGPDETVPGVGISAGEWLAKRKISVTGSDTSGYERAEHTKRPVHTLLLNKAGIQIMENMFLEEIAKERIYEFIFIATPLRIRGGTASPIRPVAVVCQ